MTLFTDITFAQVCMSLIAVGVIERLVLRLAPQDLLESMGFAQ